jgi:hypothetical protein
LNQTDVLFVSIADTDAEVAGFEINKNNDGDELNRFMQDKNAKKNDYIPSQTKKIRTRSSVVKRPSSNKKSSKKYVHRVKI